MSMTKVVRPGTGGPILQLVVDERVPELGKDAALAALEMMMRKIGLFRRSFDDDLGARRRWRCRWRCQRPLRLFGRRRWVS